MNNAFIVFGLGFGDEGKGTAVDFLTNHYDSSLNVMYCGGHQAGHQVVMPDGRSHIFSQFGSGSFHGALTYHTRESIIEPNAMHNEYVALSNLVKGLSYPIVHKKCLVTTPFHKIANHIKETLNNHGSCGVGVGETRSYYIKYGNDSIFAEDIHNKGILQDKLHLMKARYQDELFNVRHIRDYHDILNMSISTVNFRYSPYTYDDNEEHDLFDMHDIVVFESKQGVLLDETYGKHPHTTWSTVTPRYALECISKYESQKLNHEVVTKKVGVIRNHFSRHGNGPFREDETVRPLHDHNSYNMWQGSIRYGRFDTNLDNFRHSVKVSKPDRIFLTHLDYDAPGFKREYIEQICPIKYFSHGPTFMNKIVA